MSSRVNIVGKGIVGLSCAYRFAQAGFKVTVISHNDAPTASTVATGISTIKGHRVARDLLFKLKVKGHACFREQLKELASDGVIYGEGVLEPFLNAADYHTIVSRVYSGLAQEPFGNSCHYTGEETQPFFSASVSGYLKYPADLWCDAQSLLGALEKRCRLLGVDFIDALVGRLERTNDTNFSSYQIIADKQLPRADETILCTGSETPRILAASGIPLQDFSLHPGATLLFPSRADERFAFVHGKDVFLHANGGLRVGSFERKGETEDFALQALLERASAFTNPDFFSPAGARLQEGLRLRCRKMLPLVAQLGQKNPFWVISGLYKNGFQLADFIARNLVIHVNEGHFTDPDLALLKQQTVLES